MGKMIGIDLGTTWSAVAVMEGDAPVIISNEHGDRTTPSVVAFTDDNPTGIVGVQAKNQAITNPGNTVFHTKRYMGRRFSEITEQDKQVPYKMVSGPNGDTRIEIHGNQYSPPEISAKILQYLKKAAEAYLGEKVTDAVITVPAYFNDSQRQATKDAGRIAGLEVKRIINEPTAASLAYGLNKKKDQRIAVFDFGGGTFDISILEVGDDVVEVLATNGDTHLGASDFDYTMVQYIAEEFRKQTGVDIRSDRVALQRMTDAAERARIELSSTMQAQINLPYVAADAAGPKHLDMKITRATLEELIAPIVKRIEGPVRQALKDSGLKPEDIDEVLLVGGPTRTPYIQDAVRKLFKKEPNRSVNPDEVVALGAAIQAGVLSGEVHDILLLDVTPLTLGLETLGGITTALIPRNTTIPTEKAEVFSTAADSQPAVDIHVLQGERKMASDNRTLGRFQLTGILPAPRGIPQIEVAFKIDANGILSVSAKDKGTGKEQSIEIKTSSGLSDKDVEKMMSDAKEHAEEDERKAKLVEARNRADQLVYSTEKMLKEHGDKLGAPERGRIESAVESLKKAKDSDDVAEIERAMQELAEASQEVGKKIYEKVASAQGGPSAGYQEPEQPSAAKPHPGTRSGSDKPGGDNVVDAEFEVVEPKDDDK